MRGKKAKRLRREAPHCPNPGRKHGGEHKALVDRTGKVNWDAVIKMRGVQRALPRSRP